MNENEYRKFPAINYGALADFNISQDHALMPHPQKAYFEYGKAFERIVQDAITGSKLFDKRFFVVDIPGDVPDDIITAIKEGEDLKQFEVLTKKNERSKTYARKHDWMDACLDNPNLYPIGQKKVEELRMMLNNFLACTFENMPLYQLLQDAEWQVPVIWDDKKALVDCYKIMEEDPFIGSGSAEIFLFDIKTAVSFKHFEQMFYKRYWIQDLHYTEAIESDPRYSGLIDRNHMIFLVATKTPPFLVRTYIMCPVARLARHDRYERLVNNHRAWQIDGRPPKGYLGTKIMFEGEG